MPFEFRHQNWKGGSATCLMPVYRILWPKLKAKYLFCWGSGLLESKYSAISGTRVTLLLVCFSTRGHMYGYALVPLGPSLGTLSPMTALYISLKCCLKKHNVDRLAFQIRYIVIWRTCLCSMALPTFPLSSADCCPTLTGLDMLLLGHWPPNTVYLKVPPPRRWVTSFFSSSMACSLGGVQTPSATSACCMQLWCCIVLGFTGLACNFCTPSHSPALAKSSL